MAAKKLIFERIFGPKLHRRQSKLNGWSLALSQVSDSCHLGSSVATSWETSKKTKAASLNGPSGKPTDNAYVESSHATVRSQPLRDFFNVVAVESDQFGPPQRPGKAEQERRGLAARTAVPRQGEA